MFVAPCWVVLLAPSVWVLSVWVALRLLIDWADESHALALMLVVISRPGVPSSLVDESRCVM